MFLLLLAMALSSLMEVFSIAAVIPFLGILATPEVVFNYEQAQPLINYFNFRDPDDLILPLTLLFVAASILAGFMRIFLVWASTKVSFLTGHDISFMVYERSLYQPYSIHISKNSSEVINAVINKTTLTIVHFIQPIIQSLSSVVLFVAIISTLLFINSFMALIALFGIGSIYLTIGTIARRRLVANGLLTARESSNVVKALQEGLGGIRDVLIGGLQDTYLKIYRNSDYPLKMAQGNNAFITQSPRFLMEALGMSLLALIAYVFSQNSNNFLEIIPAIGALAIGAQRLLPILQIIYGSWSSLNGEKKSVYDVLQMLDQTVLNKSDQKIEPIVFNKSITLKDISFKYENSEDYILKDINVQISKGDRVGIFGSTGSGKTTLLDIIMALLMPTSGNILIDNNLDLHISPRSWQKIISHVPQDIFMSDVSFAENIAFGVQINDIDIDRVIEAAKNAQIHNFINQLPQKYNTRMGEHGAQVSGGQKQRVGIARALYNNASILFLDEATSALDSEVESSLMKSINNIDKNITIFMIAHRLTTLKNCNKVIQLEAGEIKKIGTYEQIILNNH
jgi:ATP-binding cassette subfamily B protein